MGEKEQNIRERIQKLLTLARDPGATEGERRSAACMARKLQEKYNISIKEPAEPAAVPTAEQPAAPTVSKDPKPVSRIVKVLFGIIVILHIVALVSIVAGVVMLASGKVLNALALLGGGAAVLAFIIWFLKL